MKKVLALILAAVMVFGLAACGGSTPANNAANNTAEKPSLSGTTMDIICTSETYAKLFDKFSSETGVKYNYVSMSSGEVISQLEAGKEAAADLWFGGGIDAFMSAKAKGYLAQVNFEGAKDLNPLYKDAENYWFSKGMTVVGFIVNNDILKTKNLPMPEKWDDLTNDVYKDEIIMSNPAISGTNYAVVNALLQTKGAEAGWKFFEDMNKNILYYSRRGSDPKNKVVAGEVAVGITYVDNSITSLVDTNNVTIVYPTDGMPYVPEGVAAFANSKNSAAGVAFIEWLFSSDENLTLLAELDGKTAVKIVKPNMVGVESNFDINLLMKEDLSLFGTQRTDILTRFETLMGDKVEAAN